MDRNNQKNIKTEAVTARAKTPKIIPAILATLGCLLLAPAT